jgi:hypothetical protein
MAEVAAGINAIAHALLKDLDVGKAAISLALPDRQAVTGDFEDPAGSGRESQPSGSFMARTQSKRPRILSRPQARRVFASRQPESILPTSWADWGPLCGPFS